MSSLRNMESRDLIWVTVGGIALAGFAVVISGNAAISIAVLGVSGAIGFVYLALWRFEALTLMMIALRTSIELVPSPFSIDVLRVSVLATGAYTAAALLWLARHRRRCGERVSRLGQAVALVAGVASLSAALSSDPLQAGMGASRWGFLAVFVLVLERLVDNEATARRLIYAMAASMLVPLVAGAWQIAQGGSSMLMGSSRISGSLSHPNTYGFYLVIMIITLTAVARSLPTWARAGSWALVAVGGVQLAATYSRTSYLALALGLVVVGLVGRRWGLLGITVLALAAASLVPGVADRWSDIDQDPTLRGTPGNSLAWRIDYWGDVLEASEDRRITGVGLGVVSDTTEEGREPHNDLVRALAELGVLGLLTYSGFLAILTFRAISSLGETNARREPARLERDLAEALAGVVAAYLLGSLTGNLMTQLVLLWYALTLAVAGGFALRTGIPGPAVSTRELSHV